MNEQYQTMRNTSEQIINAWYKCECNYEVVV